MPDPLSQMMREIERLKAEVRELKRRQGGISTLEQLQDVHFLMNLQAPRDIGAIFAWRETGWDFLHSLRYRAHNFEDDTVLTLLPPGTILHMLRIEAIVQVRPIDGVTPFFAEFYFPNRLMLDESDVLYQAAGHELFMTVTDAGGFQVQRSNGNHRYTCNFLMYFK